MSVLLKTSSIRVVFVARLFHKAQRLDTFNFESLVGSIASRLYGSVALMTALHKSVFALFKHLADFQKSLIITVFSESDHGFPKLLVRPDKAYKTLHGLISLCMS